MIDKSAWGPGPWQDEPDELEWNFGDVPCRIVRTPHGGNLNGYVGLPASHPWHGCHFDELDERVDVHGGLTFAGHFDDGTFATNTPTGARMQLWWLGFDCAHAWDVSPGFEALFRERGMPTKNAELFEWVYRDINYVKREVENLACQAIAVWRSVTDVERMRRLTPGAWESWK